MSEMDRLMNGFPPTPDAQVTLANWRTSPFNRWAFHHVREVVPSADLPNDPANTLELPSAPVDMGKLGIDQFFDETNTDGLVILHRGRIVFERYANGMTTESPHILMSVSKSLLGLLAGVLADRGALEPDRAVTDVIPEVGGTAYKGATIRQLLDMRAGIRRPLCRLDERADLEAHGRRPQRLHHGRSPGRAAMRRRRVHDRPRSRARRSTDGAGRGARQRADHSGELDRRHHTQR